MSAEPSVQDRLTPVKPFISGKNLTAGTTLRRSPPIELHEIADDQIVLAIPEKACAVGHQLELKFLFDREDAKFKFECTCRVTEMDPCSEGIDRVAVTLVQFDREGWDQLLKHMNGSQARIDTIFEIIQGEK